MGFFSDILDPGGFFHDADPLGQEADAKQSIVDAQQANELKRQRFDMLREDAEPLRDLRNENINRLLRMQGINQVPGQPAQPGLTQMEAIRTPFGDFQVPIAGPGTPATEDSIEFGPGDRSDFAKSPEFTTVRDAALKVQGSNPGMSRELVERANQLGQGEFGNYQNRIFNTAGFSSDGLNNTNRLLQSNIDSQVNLLNNQGADAASGLIAGANQRGQAASSGVGLLGSLFCDARLKENVQRIGTYRSGLGKYRWTWTDEAKALVGGQPAEGPMAHEVYAAMPDNIDTEHGYLIIKDARLLH